MSVHGITCCTIIIITKRDATTCLSTMFCCFGHCCRYQLELTIFLYLAFMPMWHALIKKANPYGLKIGNSVVCCMEHLESEPNPHTLDKNGIDLRCLSYCYCRNPVIVWCHFLFLGIAIKLKCCKIIAGSNCIKEMIWGESKLQEIRVWHISSNRKSEYPNGKIGIGQQHSVNRWETITFCKSE